MKKLLALSISVATLFPALAVADMQELMTALGNGKSTMDVRLRVETADDSVKKEATATTARTTLAYKTGDYQGFTGFIQFEDVTNFGQEKYNNNTGTGNTAYAVIADPSLTQVNQAFIEAYGVKFGRQKVVFDNARFVGDVGWRQNDQTFDGLTYTNKVLIPSTTFSVAYLNKINNIVGKIIPISAPMLNVRYTKVMGDFGINASAFYYGVEYDVAKTDSFQDIGVKLDGSFKDFLYEASFVQQSKYADGTSVAVPDSDYMDLQIGYKLGDFTIKAQQEVLGEKFKTPLATLHAFNGWADKFLATPAKGLEDTNIKLLAKYAGYNFVLAAHSFKTDVDGIALGTEIDASVAKNVNKNLSLLLKAAQYKGDADAAKAGVGTNDVNKLWLQAMYKF